MVVVDSGPLTLSGPVAPSLRHLLVQNAVGSSRSVGACWCNLAGSWAGLFSVRELASDSLMPYLSSICYSGSLTDRGYGVKVSCMWRKILTYRLLR